ncbi:MAG: methylenetetrahydrofolate reductase [Sulfurospirillum sp.]|nr:methylenetetrahydrofolate reductase [Sulfurospirillum sp.]
MLKNKIISKKNSILFYGLVPPKIKHTKEEIAHIASTQIKRLKDLDIDGLVLYDIQDESDRTQKIRPFPFMDTVEPCTYAREYLEVMDFPIIAYRSVGKYTKEEFTNWLQNIRRKESYSVFVGAPSANAKVNIGIKEAYRLKKEFAKDLTIGGIMIPERHTVYGNEHLKVFSKIKEGCKFFISQCVYDLMGAKRFLDDYVTYGKNHNISLVPIIFTITPCGSTQTLNFMKWLGINIPTHLEDRLKNSEDILEESVRLSRDIFEILYFYGRGKGVKIGCNVESVAIKKAEIDASMELLCNIQKIMGRV